MVNMRESARLCKNVDDVANESFRRYIEENLLVEHVIAKCNMENREKQLQQERKFRLVRKQELFEQRRFFLRYERKREGEKERK